MLLLEHVVIRLHPLNQNSQKDGPIIIGPCQESSTVAHRLFNNGILSIVYIDKNTDHVRIFV